MVNMSLVFYSHTRKKMKLFKLESQLKSNKMIF